MDSVGVLAKLTRLIKSCTYNSKSKISFGGELSEEFQVATGLRQGDACTVQHRPRISYEDSYIPS